MVNPKKKEALCLPSRRAETSRERERCAKIIYHNYGTEKTEKLVLLKDFKKDFTKYSRYWGNSHYPLSPFHNRMYSLHPVSTLDFN